MSGPVDGESGSSGRRRKGRLGGSTDFLVEVLRARPAARRLVSGVSVLLALAGLGFLGFPLGTNLYSGRLQDRLEARLDAPELLQAYTQGEVAIGDSLTRIVIPALSVDVIVVEGTSTSALRAGAGHYPRTPLPGEEGNVAIAGHRTTFGKPFANLDRLKTGDEIILETPLGRHSYRITRSPYVVDATDWSPIAQTPDRTLTLTTCHPKGSDRQRLIVKAALDPSSSAAAT